MKHTPTQLKAAKLTEAKRAELGVRDYRLAQAYMEDVWNFGQWDPGGGNNGALYRAAADNAYSAQGIRCENCVAYQPEIQIGADGQPMIDIDCCWVDADVEPGGACKLAVIPAPLITIAPMAGDEETEPGADPGETEQEPMAEAADVDLAESGSIEAAAWPIKEAAGATKMRVKLIQAGQGSSGFYPAEVLKRDGPRAFPAGTHMYLNHATESEESARPEGDVTQLAAVTTSAAEWDEYGSMGPGLYAEAKPFADTKPFLAERQAHIGVSIRARGKARMSEGKRIIEELTQGRSVDFVTRAGAGGQFELAESARVEPASAASDERSRRQANPLQETHMEKNDDRLQALERENKSLQEALTENNKKLIEATSRIERMEEANQIAAVNHRVRTLVAADGRLSESAQARIVRQFADQRSVDGLDAQVKEAIDQEVTYLESHLKATTPTFRVPAPAPIAVNVDESKKRIGDRFAALVKG